MRRAGRRRPRDEAEEGRLAAERRLYLQAVLRGQREAAMGIVTASLKAGHPVLDLYLKILQPVQYEIGRLWERNAISVAEEHMATAITQSVMARLYPLVPQERQPCRGRMVLTGVEGEMHQVGANMVADVVEIHGWEVRFLGTNLPHEGILRVIEEQRPDVVGVSATMLFNLPRVRSLIEAVRALPIPRPRILVGGAAFRTAAGAWRRSARTLALSTSSRRSSYCAATPGPPRGKSMVLALSRFLVVNGMEEQVAVAFLNRPHLVEEAAGFLGLEVFRDRRDSRAFYLATRWSDESCFREWHRSEAHRSSHQGIPGGLKLDPSFTEVRSSSGSRSRARRPSRSPTRAGC